MTAVPVSRDRAARTVPPKPAIASNQVDPDRRERRRTARRTPDRLEPFSRVRLRAGRELDVVNISDLGVLVDGVARLHPGAHVDVHIVTRDGRVLVRARVVRAFVSHVAADAIRYGGALAFEQTIETAAG